MAAIASQHADTLKKELGQLKKKLKEEEKEKKRRPRSRRKRRRIIFATPSRPYWVILL
jgi:ABC-type Zn uptake system ZnuABC Zn-binding protein ZnuA